MHFARLGIRRFRPGARQAEAGTLGMHLLSYTSSTLSKISEGTQPCLIEGSSGASSYRLRCWRWCSEQRSAESGITTPTLRRTPAPSAI
jgi:hypothetical protein